MTAAALSKRLRRETRELHARVERAGIMPALLLGQLQRDAYVTLLRNLHPIYAALEAALDRHADHPGVLPIRDRALYREAPLRSDLDVLHATWQTLPMQPATLAYVERLEALGRDAPPLLAAHAYVRYLGDLSGGQLLRPIVATSLGLALPDGTRFYDFGPAVRTLARRLRDCLDAIDHYADANANADAIVAEARSAFERHVLLFEQLVAATSARPPAP